MFKIWIKAIRPHQWVKNLLIFVPLLASHKIDQLSLLVSGVLAFFSFGLCVSSVYILNDIFDLTDDRLHHSKKYRPFASRQLSVKAGLIALPFFLVAAFTLSSLSLPWQFTATLATYYALTLAYSASLKKKAIIDVLTLALLYTIRIMAGVFAFQIPITFWMLAFSMFIFLSLALLKRYAELHERKIKIRSEINTSTLSYDELKSIKIGSRGYYLSDLEIISSFGIASGYLSVLIMALYIQDQRTTMLYSHPKIIWIACPLLLFWISRLWMLTNRGEMHHDPILFTIKDRISHVIGILFFIIFYLAM